MRRLTLPRSRAGRALIAFWLALLLAAVILVATLQWLGSPTRPRKAVLPVAPPALPGPRPRPAAIPTPRADIAPPDAALLEPAPRQPGAMLPRIAADGRQARTVYAAASPPVPPGARPVAVLMDGIGLSAADSLDAIDRLPPAVSLAVSPYGVEPGPVLAAARRAGHELLLSLPMEPAGAPLDDEGAQALSERDDAETNRRRLQWALSRIQGYAGVTNAFVGMRGERFAASAGFAEIARTLARRGLFYLDATPAAPPAPSVASADADLRLDDPPDAASIDRQLATLEQVARDKGSAIGVAGPLSPVAVGRLADWARTLPGHGFVLVPVSRLVHNPVAATKGGDPAPG